MIPALLVLWISWALDLVSAGIIPPPWVDLARNPCSKDSWQQLYWPMDGQCYRIFQRGPCRETFELVFNGKSGAAECRCPHHHVMWIGDGLCYRQFSRGPCSLDEYLAGVEGAVDETQRAECRKRKPCPEGWLFWPQDGQCYSNYSKGPCFKGDLIYQDPETGDVKCGCESKRMPKFYWPQSYACYEHFTTGPCNEGYLFIHNRTARQVQCACNANLTAHYHPHLGECHQLNVQGPCARGQWYVFSPERRRPECQCRPQHTPWASTSREGGVCHREYTRGPCGANEAVVHNTTTGSGTCVPVPCKPGQLFFPQLGQCFRIGSRGPCPAGKLVMYEMYHRSTHRGLCSCSKDLSHNFWPETGECFETDTRGPCGDLQVYKYNSTLAQTHCECEAGAGELMDEDNSVSRPIKRCYKIGTVGPCSRNQILQLVTDNDDDDASATATAPAASPTASSSSASTSGQTRNLLQCKCKPGFVYNNRYSECVSERTARLFAYRKLLKSRPQ